MDQSDFVYVMGLVEKESVLSKRVAALEAEVKNLTASNKPSATCLLCGHMEVCYYYKHSGGGCCGKFVPRTSHIG